MKQFIHRVKVHFPILLIYLSDNDQNVREDQEIQAFRQELELPRSMDKEGGCGINVIFLSVFIL